jgi:hypothetical protein
MVKFLSTDNAKAQPAFYNSFLAVSNLCYVSFFGKITTMFSGFNASDLPPHRKQPAPILDFALAVQVILADFLA